jgi:hypothetical protein
MFALCCKRLLYCPRKWSLDRSPKYMPYLGINIRKSLILNEISDRTLQIINDQHVKNTIIAETRPKSAWSPRPSRARCYFFNQIDTYSPCFTPPRLPVHHSQYRVAELELLLPNNSFPLADSQRTNLVPLHPVWPGPVARLRGLIGIRNVHRRRCPYRRRFLDAMCR